MSESMGVSISLVLKSCTTRKDGAGPSTACLCSPLMEVPQKYDQVLPETKCEIFGNPADYYQVQICDPPVIEHGVLENGPFIGGLPIESPNQRGFSAAMFDCQRVYPLGY